ncbi:MAG: hypothetical protein IIW70_04510 [Bacteroidales bacterium]|nr:hypothetical protein [Bacteroidales bacterium]
MMKHKIVEQAVRWLEKIGIGVEYNAELQEFELGIKMFEKELLKDTQYALGLLNAESGYLRTFRMNTT